MTSRAGLIAALLLSACDLSSQRPATGAALARAHSPLSSSELRTTDGTIALANLDAQIDGEEHLASYRPLTLKQRAGIIELLGMRGQFRGRIADYERAALLADQLAADYPTDGAALLARAKTRATLHRFAEALADLEAAERLGTFTPGNDRLRAAIYQATGRYDEALAIRRAAAETRPDIGSLAAAASVYADRGDVARAEQLFTEAQFHYRDVSPFPVAWLYFQQGLMWMREGNLPRARELLAAAHARLPAYAAAQGHLAEVEAALGNQANAVELLEPLARASDDPDYAAQLARILAAAGRDEAAQPWRELARQRYEDLCARHPEAFADHAAEFWLAAGDDPAKATAWAQRNVANRATPRAFELLLQAALATSDSAVACDAAAHLRDVHQWPSLRALTDRAAPDCHRS